MVTTSGELEALVLIHPELVAGDALVMRWLVPPEQLPFVGPSRRCR